MQVSSAPTLSANLGGTSTVTVPIAKFRTTDATPTQFWTRALTPGQHFGVEVSVVGHDNVTNNCAKFKASSAYVRSAGGVSKRGGSVNGSTDYVVNDFAGQNARVVFGDPAATDTAVLSIVGKAGATIDWTIFVTYGEGV